jgi:hypothetical protein
MAKKATSGKASVSSNKIVSGNGAKVDGKFEMTGKRYTKLSGIGGRKG